MALAWLGDAFGLEEHLRWTDENGVVRHAEMRVGSAFVELSGGSEDQPTPKALGAASGALVVLVDDVGAHLAHARSRGVDIVSEPEDRPWGLRQYTAEDPDGHRWEFSQFLRHVAPEEWSATFAASHSGIVPTALLAAVTATQRVRGPSTFSNAPTGSSSVSGSGSAQRTVAPLSRAAASHGATFASWSRRVQTISSPGRSPPATARENAKVRAVMLGPKTTPPGSAASSSPTPRRAQATRS